MDCKHLRFGIENVVPYSTITASPEPEANTPVTWIKDEWKARRAVWVSPPGEIVITGTLAAPKVLEYVVLAGILVTGQAEVKLTVFSGGQAQPVQEFETDYVALSDLIPLGEWRAGIDPYGGQQANGTPQSFVVWLDEAVPYDSYELRIRGVDGTALGEVRLTTLMLGTKLEMQRNFGSPSTLTPMTPPALVQVASGGWIPSRVQRQSATLSVTFPMMTDRDRALLGRMERELNGQPFLISAYPERGGWQELRYQFIGRFRDANTYQHYAHGLHATELTIVEI